MGLKVQAVMSFHACGGNIGDSVNIPLPSWVLDLEKDVEQLFYRDRRGDASREYISLSCDNASVFPRKSVAVKPAVAQERAKVVEAETKEMDLVNTTIREARVSSGTDRTENLHVAVAEHAGNVTKGGGTESSATQLRTALEVYRDFMAAFRDATEELWRDGTLEEIQVQICCQPPPLQRPDRLTVPVLCTKGWLRALRRAPVPVVPPRSTRKLSIWLALARNR
jgi:hypothetical protein